MSTGMMSILKNEGMHNKLDATGFLTHARNLSGNG